MRIILLGAPGAGKGTQSALIQKKFNIPQISTGDILRSAVKNKTELGKIAETIMANGELVPDELIIDLIKTRLLENDCKDGFIFDGFPRTITQAESIIKEGISIDYVIEINLSDEQIIERLSGRRVHKASGRIYHIKYNPPKKPNIDDITGEPLIQRDDDKVSTIKNRLKVYHEQTEPLIEFYKKLSETNNLIFTTIDGSLPQNEIYSKIAFKLSSKSASM